MKDHPKIFLLFVSFFLPSFLPSFLPYLGEWRWRSWVKGAGCVLRGEGQRLDFGLGNSEMFRSVCVCHMDNWTSMSAVLGGGV